MLERSFPQFPTTASGARGRSANFLMVVFNFLSGAAIGHFQEMLAN